MNFWTVDLTTRDGAENAASAAGLISFIAAGLTVVGVLFSFFLTDPGPRDPDVNASLVMFFMLIGPALELMVFLVAGFRLRAGKGLVWAGVACVLLVLEVIPKLIALAFLGLVINIVMLVALVNGVRAAWALRRDSFSEDFADVFN